MTMIAVKLTDQEWRLKSEELAKTELRRQAKRAQLDEENDEWKDRKKDVESQIDAMTSMIDTLAKEVDSHETMIEPQQTLPLTAPEESPSSEEPREGREPGAEG